MSVRMLTLAFALGTLVWMPTLGCSPGGPAEEPKVSVTGRLTNAGQPLTIPPAFAEQKGMRPMLNFTREESDKPGVSVPAITEMDGRFQAKLPKGKYRIAVQFGYASPKEQELLSKFDRRVSPILREVTGDGQEISIDLSKPQGP
jgi:hypothetical protein